MSWNVDLLWGAFDWGEGEGMTRELDRSVNAVTVTMGGVSGVNEAFV